MKHKRILALAAAIMLLLTACSETSGIQEGTASAEVTTEETTEAAQIDDTVKIVLSDDGVRVEGDETAVYTANDIVYYESGKDHTYGEGGEADAHDAETAAAHTVVHIAKPGVYALAGQLSKGQIAVDLGKDAKKDPNAVVTLILDNVDITCEVAPAIIFYNVYECGSKDTETASKTVDTSTAGANVIIADGSENNIKGAYVARIYDPESVVLSEDGSEVEDADKLHKYDGAFYSRMSMNISGEEENSGILNIEAQNEGLDSELHLTLNGGNINIRSGNDGINTNEDGVSVTTINGGNLTIEVSGETGEGDGIDSNGWLVINGGNVIAAACSDSADAGIDSDMGIHINGGTVIASGHMLDRIEDGGQTYAVFSFAQKQLGEESICLAGTDHEIELSPKNAYSILLYSSPDLSEGEYTLFSGDRQLSGRSGMMGMRPQDGAVPPEGMKPPDGEQPQPPDGMEHPERPEPPDGEEPPEMPDGMEPPQKPEGEWKPDGEFAPDGEEAELTTQFIIKEGANMFSNITATE